MLESMKMCITKDWPALAGFATAWTKQILSSDQPSGSFTTRRHRDMALVARRRLLQEHSQSDCLAAAAKPLTLDTISKALDALLSSVAAPTLGLRSPQSAASRARRGAAHGRAVRRRSPVAFATVSMALPLRPSDPQRAS